MRRSLVVLALALGGVLLLEAPAWAPRLYGMERVKAGGYNRPAIVRPAIVGASADDRTRRQRQYLAVDAGTAQTVTWTYSFDGTPIEGPQNPTRERVEAWCTNDNYVVVTSERVQTPAPEGVPEDALAVPAVGKIKAGNPPTFDLELVILEDAWGEYYLRARCVEEHDLKDQGVQGTPQEEELEELGDFLDSSEAERERRFKPFRNFGTNLYVYPR
jgi:hypothetical protein